MRLWGIAGLVGAGRTELLETLFGITPAVGGLLEVEGKETAVRNPREAQQLGHGSGPRGSQQQGLVIEMSVRENLSLAALRRDAGPGGLLDRAKESAICEEMIPRLRIKTPNDAQVLRFLSGGNQQKVVLGKWLTMMPRILLLDEPTRGIDVGRQARGLSVDRGAGARRRGDPLCFQRAGGSAGHGRPRVRHATRPHQRRIGARGK